MEHVSRLVIAFCTLLVIAGCGDEPSTRQSEEPTKVAQIPQDKPVLPPAQTAVELANPIPAPIGTFEYPTPGITPTWLEPTISPTPAVLEPARLITATTLSTVTLGLNLDFRLVGVISDTDAVQSLAWSPYGDGFIYVTASGKLYWSDIAGSSRTLLYMYSGDSDFWGFDRFEKQAPRGDTMYIVHQGEMGSDRRLPGHMDIVHFAQGQTPTFEHADGLPLLWDVQWWRPDRASGVLLMSYVPDGYVGGDRLVTLDATGQIVDDRNIPYMYSGAIQPNGDWLAYGTNQQATNTSFNGADATTAYLLNLKSGERLQVSPSGEGSVVSWSPDGKWLITGCGIMTADGSERLCMYAMYSSIGNDVAWSPDSKRLAWSVEYGGCEPEGCAPYGSEFYVVDLPSEKVADFGADARAARGIGHIRRPKWSPDGSLMAVLAFDPSCPDCLPGQARPGEGLERQPAIYILSLDSGK